MKNKPVSPTVTISGLLRKLVSIGKLSESTASDIAEKAKQNNQPLVTTLIEQKILSSLELAMLSSEAVGIPFLDLKSIHPDYFPKNNLNEKIIKTYHGLPLYKRGNRLYVAISDPTNISVFIFIYYTFFILLTYSIIRS